MKEILKKKNCKKKENNFITEKIKEVLLKANNIFFI